MVRFGSGLSDAASAAEALRRALSVAREALGDAAPRLAIVFVSVGYPDLEETPAVLRAELGAVPFVGGTAGGAVFGSSGYSHRGASVVLLGGEVEIAVRSADVSSTDMLAVVPAAEEIAREAVKASSCGYPHHACLVFAPGIVDGDALVAAVRKGAGAGTQLAGGLTGDDLTFDRARVLDGHDFQKDRVVLVGLCTRAPVGIAARHGWRPLGPQRVVTRAEGPLVHTIDGRPALEVWREDAGRSPLPLPTDPRALVLHFANHFPLGIVEEPSGAFRTRSASAPAVRPEEPSRELVARTPYAILADGSIQLSASIAEGSRVRIMHGTPADLLHASRDAATTAAHRAGGKLAGALVLGCSGRLGALGEGFPEEPVQIREHLGAPFAGACVFGEIARNVRDADAFFNVTAVVLAFGTGVSD